MANAIGQMFNAFKEQTPLVVYSYRTDQTRRAGRDGFEEVANQEQMRPADHQVHLAGAPPRHDPGDRAPRLQGGVDAALRPVLHLLALGLQRRARAHRDHRRRNRSIRACACGPIREEIERAAKLLVEAKMPLMIVGDEIYKAKAVRQGGEARRAARHAGDAGAPALCQLPRDRIRSGSATCRAARSNSLTYPKDADVVINVGNKLQHNGPAPIVPRGPKFIDMRIDHWSMGNVMLTEVPLVSPTSATGSTT